LVLRIQSDIEQSESPFLGERIGREQTAAVGRPTVLRYVVKRSKFERYGFRGLHEPCPGTPTDRQNRTVEGFADIKVVARRDEMIGAQCDLLTAYAQVHVILSIA
jgi:hypothetical protein